MGGLSESIEVLISDNCSTDTTMEVANAFVQKVPEARLICQPINLGAEGNFWELWKHASGEYVWMVGDDDLLEQDAIGHVLLSLSLKPDLLILNYSRWDSRLERCELANVYGSQDQVYSDINSIIRRFGPDLAYISICVVRRDALRCVTESAYKRLAHTGFAFMYGIYQASKGAEKIAFIGRSLVRNRNADTVPYNWDKYFISGMAEVFRSLKNEGFDSHSINVARSSVVRRYVVPTFKRRRLLGSLRISQVGMVVQYYPDILKTWLLVVPLLAVPPALLRMIDRSRASGSKAK